MWCNQAKRVVSRKIWFIYLSINLFVCLFVYLFIFIYSFIYLPFAYLFIIFLFIYHFPVSIYLPYCPDFNLVIHQERAIGSKDTVKPVSLVKQSNKQLKVLQMIRNKINYGFLWISIIKTVVVLFCFVLFFGEFKLTLLDHIFREREVPYSGKRIIYVFVASVTNNQLNLFRYHDCGL